MMRNLSILLVLFCLAGSKSLAQIIAGQRPVTLFSVRAVDEKTGEALPASFRIKLHIADRQFEGTTQPGGENFNIQMFGSDTVTVETSTEGYFTIEELLLVSCDTCGYYQYTALLEKRVDSVFTDLKVNDVIKLDKIYFDQSKYDLRSESRDQLEKLYRTLRDNPKLKISIDGHTDNVGDPRLNQLLSENRAKVIYTYLIRKNIAATRLQHRGFGSKQPVAPNDTEENKSLNRRVEFVVLEN